MTKVRPLVGAHSHTAIYSVTEYNCKLRILSWLKVMDAPDDIGKILGPNEKVELYIKQKIYHP